MYSSGGLHAVVGIIFYDALHLTVCDGLPRTRPICGRDEEPAIQKACVRATENGQKAFKCGESESRLVEQDTVV